VNPASAGGRTGRHFDRIARAVTAVAGDFRAVFTRRPGEARHLAREAVEGGERLVVAVGGDGTASEVVDGLAGEGREVPAEVVFGCIPRGTGGDLRRTLGWSSEPEAAARAVAEGATRTVDLGIVEFLDHQGRPGKRHFVNVSSCGISGEVVRELQRSGRLMGGKLTYMWASGRSLLRYHDRRVRWRVDAGPWNEEPITALCVCNGRYFGAGMMVAPDARIDDGWFDVTVWSGLGFKDFLVRRGMLYDGSHVRLPNTRRVRARVVEAEPVDGAEVQLDVDGEHLGRLPARWTIVPGGLRVKVPLSPP
jgi:YegS/Rv2252/BmrU family lipid kinase